MTKKDTLIRYLEIEPRSRERKYKDRAIINLLIKKYGLFKDIPKEYIIDFVRDYTNFDRCWRKILEERKDLRGSDYEKKSELESYMKKDLGYFVS